MKNHSFIKANDSNENLLLSQKPALVEYVTECNENRCLNLECFTDRVPSQKEGYLPLFTSAEALGNRYYLTRLLLLAMLKFLREGETGVGVVGHGERHTANTAVSGHVTPWAAPARLAQVTAVKLWQSH